MVDHLGFLLDRRGADEVLRRRGRRRGVGHGRGGRGPGVIVDGDAVRLEGIRSVGSQARDRVVIADDLRVRVAAERFTVEDDGGVGVAGISLSCPSDVGSREHDGSGEQQHE